MYVTKFRGKICLLLKTLAEWKTSVIAALGETSGPFCPEEITGDHLEAKAVRRHYHAAFISFKSRTTPVVQESPLPLEDLERVADKICQEIAEKQAPEKGCCGNQEEVEEKILFMACQCGETS